VQESPFSSGFLAFSHPHSSPLCRLYSLHTGAGSHGLNARRMAPFSGRHSTIMSRFRPTRRKAARHFWAASRDPLAMAS
jgi:hypothetical protein